MADRDPWRVGAHIPADAGAHAALDEVESWLGHEDRQRLRALLSGESAVQPLEKSSGDRPAPAQLFPHEYRKHSSG